VLVQFKPAASLEFISKFINGEDYLSYDPSCSSPSVTIDAAIDPSGVPLDLLTKEALMKELEAETIEFERTKALLEAKMAAAKH
jgi:hypothetical protein